jgi:hypothetical protein
MVGARRQHTNVEVRPGDEVALEVNATLEFSHAGGYTFCLANGVRFSLPYDQELSGQIIWHGKKVES